MKSDDESPQNSRRTFQKAPWLMRFKAWWNLPRAIGLIAAVLGLTHYLPLPYLSVPGLMQLHADIAPELIGIGITLILIDWALEKRQLAELKAQLIRQMGSPHNEVADTAVRELAHYGWLYNGSLNGAFLEEANLRDVNLEGAVLSRAYLYRAQLIRANLWRANLNSAILTQAQLDAAKLVNAEMRKISLQQARLCNANLGDSDLSNSDLVNANLGESKLQNTNLSNADIQGAVLQGANLRGTIFTGIKGWTIEQLEKGENPSSTIMPDGVRLGRIPIHSSKSQGSPTFDEWKAQYLAKHGGTETDLRDKQ